MAADVVEMGVSAAAGDLKLSSNSGTYNTGTVNAAANITMDSGNSVIKK